MVGAKEKIHLTVAAWEGVASQPHRFGGIEFRLGKREFGHLHGDSLLDIPFPLKVRNELVASGRVAPHHILPESGWVSFYIKEEQDVDEAIRLLDLSYELTKKKLGKEKFKNIGSF
ncbi:MAG: luciferase family protein [Bacteroidota bacterium]